MSGVTDHIPTMRKPLLTTLFCNMQSPELKAAEAVSFIREEIRMHKSNVVVEVKWSLTFPGWLWSTSTTAFFTWGFASSMQTSLCIPATINLYGSRFGSESLWQEDVTLILCTNWTIHVSQNRTNWSQHTTLILNYITGILTRASSISVGSHRQ